MNSVHCASDHGFDALHNHLHPAMVTTGSLPVLLVWKPHTKSAPFNLTLTHLRYMNAMCVNARHCTGSAQLREIKPRLGNVRATRLSSLKRVSTEIKEFDMKPSMKFGYVHKIF